MNMNLKTSLINLWWESLLTRNSTLDLTLLPFLYQAKPTFWWKSHGFFVSLFPFLGLIMHFSNLFAHPTDTIAQPSTLWITSSLSTGFLRISFGTQSTLIKVEFLFCFLLLWCHLPSFSWCSLSRDWKISSVPLTARLCCHHWHMSRHTSKKQWHRPVILRNVPHLIMTIPFPSCPPSKLQSPQHRDI